MARISPGSPARRRRELITATAALAVVLAVVMVGRGRDPDREGERIPGQVAGRPGDPGP